MPVIVRTLTIPAPAQAVWAVLADVNRQPEWMRDLRSVEVLTQGPPGVGTRALGRVRMFGLGQDDPIEIDAFDPPRHFGIRHEGIFRGRGDLWLEPLPGGRATRVTWREELRPNLAALGLPARLAQLVEAFDPLFGPVFELVFRADLRRLRERVLAA
ncbi:MAG: SRPBCC family protein [Candidatus Limnocylindrales bacterium]